MLAFYYTMYCWNTKNFDKTKYVVNLDCAILANIPLEFAKN